MSESSLAFTPGFELQIEISIEDKNQLVTGDEELDNQGKQYVGLDVVP